MKNRLKKHMVLLSKSTGHKINNQGSTLLTVIICLAFISILGSLMLSVTMTNLQMKIVESKSKKNFYSCEVVMEKIRIAVQERASEAVKYVYENEVLAKYATYLAMPEIDRNSAIKEKVAARMIRTMGGLGDGPGDTEILASAISTGVLIQANYFVDNLYLESADNDIVTWPSLIYKVDGSDFTIRMNQIVIEYVSNDYRTAISSDIVITIPDFSFTNPVETEVVSYLIKQPFQDYVMLADDKITSDNYADTNNILGNVYAGGGGININGQDSDAHIVNLDGGTIVTRGNITVSNTAKLNIGTTSTPVIWANNLMTNTTVANPSGTTDLNIKGISVIKDDLALEGIDSNVNFLGGAYIGYTGTHNAKGSSMMINGAGSNLDLSNLEDLILAGRAHVSIKDSDINRDSDILTGESIAFKSNQRAYLLPGGFITNILHNPITQDDLNPLTGPTGSPTIDIIDDTSATGIEYTKYVDITATPYKIAVKKTGSTVLRYYYFNFTSGKLADEFLKSYMNSSYFALNSMDAFSLGTVTLPTGGTSSVVGNSMSYNSTDGVELNDGLSLTYTNDATLDEVLANTILSVPVYQSTVLKDKTVGMLNNAYSRISHLLTLDNAEGYEDADMVVASKIIPSGVDYVIDPANPFSTTIYTDFKRNSGNLICNNTTDSTTKSFWVVDGDVTFYPDTIFNGFLIATGKITIGDRAKINGMIISTGENGSSTITVGNGAKVVGRVATVGEIILGQACELSTNATVEGELTAMFTAEGTVLTQLFKNSEMSVNVNIENTASSLVDLSQMISYENWKKIE